MPVELGSAPPDLPSLDGITNVVVDGQTLECDVVGSMETLMRLLSEAGVKHMTTREPSLEEIFVSHYGGPSERKSTRLNARH